MSWTPVTLYRPYIAFKTDVTKYENTRSRIFGFYTLDNNPPPNELSKLSFIQRQGRVNNGGVYQVQVNGKWKKVNIVTFADLASDPDLVVPTFDPTTTVVNAPFPTF